MLRTSVLSRIAVAVAVVCGVLAVAPSPSSAAGVSTHGWMAVSAIPEVTDPDLRALLEAHEHQVRAGGMFPDAGYVPGNTFGEEAHWQRFVEAYIDQILARDDCGDLTDPAGPCADMVAHLMGMAGHGMGDEVWDWLFEPYGPDLDEYFTHPDNTAFNEGGAESQMDVVALGVHGVPRPTIPDLPSIPALIAAFDQAGLSGVEPREFALLGLGEAVWDVERQWVDTYLADIQAAMPWMSANMVTAPGGVDFAATAIAGYWESLWGRLLGDRPPTRVSITYPAPGQTDVPATGWERDSFQPGSSRGRGGARQRITAVLTSTPTYRVPGGDPVQNELADGTMTITDRLTGQEVPVKAGFPRLVPYGADAGEHLIDVQPASDLGPCRWFDVAVGVRTPLLDRDGTTITPHRWSFRTECTGNAITGTVVGPDGEAVAGAWVLAYRPTDGFAPTAIGVTGTDGAYAIPDLPAERLRRSACCRPTGRYAERRSVRAPPRRRRRPGHGRRHARPARPHRGPGDRPVRVARGRRAGRRLRSDGHLGASCRDRRPPPTGPTHSLRCRPRPTWSPSAMPGDDRLWFHAGAPGIVGWPRRSTSSTGPLPLRHRPADPHRLSSSLCMVDAGNLAISAPVTYPAACPRAHPPDPFALALAALALLLAACGSGDGDGASSDTTRATVTTTTLPEDTGERGPVTIEHRFGTTTLDEVPQRVVVADHQWLDTLVGMGIPTVGHPEDPYVGNESGQLAWQRGKIAAESEGIAYSSSWPLEQVAALEPDLILATYTITSQDQYDALNKIAPTIGPMSDRTVDRWDTFVETAGKIFHRERRRRRPDRRGAR